MRTPTVRTPRVCNHSHCHPFTRAPILVNSSTCPPIHTLSFSHADPYGRARILWQTNSHAHICAREPIHTRTHSNAHTFACKCIRVHPLLQAHLYTGALLRMCIYLSHTHSCLHTFMCALIRRMGTHSLRAHHSSRMHPIVAHPPIYSGTHSCAVSRAFIPRAPIRCMRSHSSCVRSFVCRAHPHTHPFVSHPFVRNPFVRRHMSMQSHSWQRMFVAANK